MISLLSLNIEGDKHIERIVNYFQKNKFDVVCFQEVFQSDLPVFEEILGMKSYFTPTMNVSCENPFLAKKGIWGLALFTKEEIIGRGEYYYVGDKNIIPQFLPQDPNSGNRAVSWISFVRHEKVYTVCTTHFTWSIGGRATKEQSVNMQKLINYLAKKEPLILCGDFNAPRGGLIFQMLSNRYMDNIPDHIETTIDQRLHREKNLQLIVDGLFTSHIYNVSTIQIVDGLSDHKSIQALIT